ncbi:MAG: sodium:calcium symporter [Planctomycetota bacterium]|nr:MAG: sodium:calcium symporter [Planctomycetota bacterium]
MPKPKEEWGTRIGVILAVAGSAVGLGNFLRFPGQAAQHGGGAFMIPYFCAMLLLGIPICWAEWIMGRYGGRKGFNSCPAIFGVLGRNSVWRYFGVLGLLIPVAVYMYYVLIEAWCLGYAWSFLYGSIDLGNEAAQYAAKSKEFFEQFTGGTEDGALFQGGLQPLLVFALITFALNFALIYRGVSKGIEAFCIRAMPIMALCAVLVLIRVLTLDTPDPSKPQLNVVNGLGFMWNPQGKDGGPWYTALTDAETWLAAAGQIFFSLSVGFGIIVNYASYLKKDDDVVLSGLTAASTNEFFEVCLGGLITIPAAFIFLGAAGAVGGTFGLGFNTLPVVFKYMPMGRIVGFLWFFMLFLAAITSSLSMLQPAIAFLEEGLNLGRRASVTLLGMITAMGSCFIVYFSKGLTALDTMDFWVGTALIYVLATIEVILFAWFFGVEKAYEEAHRGAALRIPRIWKFVIKYVSPLYLLIVFVFWCRDNLPDRINQLGSKEGTVPLLSIVLIGTVAVFFLLLIHIASRRWNRTARVSAMPGAEVTP